MIRLRDTLNSDIGNELLELWREYEAGKRNILSFLIFFILSNDLIF